MNENTIKDIVYKYCNEGFCCAESVAKTINELSAGKCELACKATSGLCGGIGRSREDVCGALSGGVVTLGFMYGRDKGSEDISKAVSLSAELRQLFINEFGTTVCKDVITCIEKKPEYSSCKDVTAKIAWHLYCLIKK